MPRRSSSTSWTAYRSPSNRRAAGDGSGGTAPDQHGSRDRTELLSALHFLTYAPYATWTFDCTAVPTPTGVDLRGPHARSARTVRTGTATPAREVTRLNAGFVLREHNVRSWPSLR